MSAQTLFLRTVLHGCPLSFLVVCSAASSVNLRTLLYDARVFSVRRFVQQELRVVLQDAELNDPVLQRLFPRASLSRLGLYECGKREAVFRQTVCGGTAVGDFTVADLVSPSDVGFATGATGGTMATGIRSGTGKRARGKRYKTQSVSVAPTSCVGPGQDSSSCAVHINGTSSFRRGVRIPCLSTRMYDEALRDACRRNFHCVGLSARTPTTTEHVQCVKGHLWWFRPVGKTLVKFEHVQRQNDDLWWLRPVGKTLATTVHVQPQNRVCVVGGNTSFGNTPVLTRHNADATVFKEVNLSLDHLVVVRSTSRTIRHV